MKKYFLGLIAVVFAIAFSAFTKPEKMFATAQFKYLVTNGFASGSVSDISKWQFDNTQLSCSGDNVEACAIVVSDVFYHLVGEDQVPTLNDATFIATNRTGTPDASDQLMTIAVDNPTVSTKYLVISSGSTVTAIDNQAENF